MEASLATEVQRVPIDRTRSLPWYVTAMALAATSIVVGVIWDISWHSTIGRDTFWTPAHVAIYFGGVLAGFCGGFLAIKTTFFGTDEERRRAVSFWGFRAPLGAWLASWGGIAMITSAPFDDWWHNAYGLDVQILSPPHTLLLLGMLGVTLGALLLAVAYQNRHQAGAGASSNFGLVYLYVSGVLLALVAVMGTEYRWPNEQHTATFYLVACAVYPMFLIGPARAARASWPATRIAAVYMLVALSMIWILPLFRAEPKLAPIFNPVDRMVTDAWPMLLVLPALVIDLVLRWRERRGGGRLLPAVLLAAAFLAVFFAVQWYFSIFLISDLAESRFFASNQWDYGARLGEWTHEFWGLERDPVTAASLAACFGLAAVSSALGLGWGAWMRKVQR